MSKRKSNWRRDIKIVIFIILFYLLYSIGVSFRVILLLGAITLIIILLRGTIYRKIDRFLNQNFHFLSKLKPRTRKIIIIIAFVLIYVALKQIVFAILKSVGIDIQNSLAESITKSLS